MAKMLNLDEVSAKEERVLRFQGIEYPMKTISVRDFIDMTRRGEALDADKDSKMTDQLEWMVDMVSNLFPTMPEEVVGSFDLTELGTIIDFARSNVDDEAESVKKPLPKKQRSRK